MKAYFKSMAGLVFTIGTLTVSGQSQQEKTHQAFVDLQSLLGTWSMVTKNNVLYESWLKRDDSTLIGRSYKINGKDTVILEQVELVIRSGRIMYIPTVEENKNKPVAFDLVKLENGTYTFENKAHDFPQRIIYNLPHDNDMHAWIEGDVNGAFKRSDFKYQKVL